MKTKIFTLFLALVAGAGTMFASDTSVDGIWYNFDDGNLTAEVTYQGDRYDSYSNEYSGEVIIPASVTYNDQTYSVTSIGSSAFYGCSGLTSVEIPNSVTHIGDYAFSYCWGLTSVTIPNSVTSIGSGAFEDCSGLTSVTIPNSVTSIGERAFGYCTGLTSVTIGNSVTSIGWRAFFECSSLPVVDNLRYADTYLVEAADKTLSSYTIKDGTKWIGDEAFKGCSGLTSVTIPNSVTSIGNDAFSGCSGLTSVTIPNSVTSIGNSAFYVCFGLTSVTIPNSVTSIGNSAFSGCSGLTSVTIPNSVTSIGGYAFYGCSGLISVTIGNSVTSIGEWAFYGCTGLTSIEIPNSVTSIGFNVFCGCKNLLTLKIPSSVTYSEKDYYYHYGIGGTWSSEYAISVYYPEELYNLQSVEAPAWFFDTPEQMWMYCPKNLEHVVVNNGELTDDAFGVISRSYKTIESLDISAVTNTELADEAFKGLYNLQSLILPANLTKIDYLAVAECVKLQSITIPASATEIDDRALENCRSLSAVQFAGKNVTRIGNWAFYNCHALQNLSIPEGVTEIGDGAFYGCTYLNKLSMPASVQSIGDNAFALCSKLGRMDVDALLPPTVEDKTFYEVSTEAPVYVPDESVDTYKSHAVWGRLNIIGKSQAPMAIDNLQSDQVQSSKVFRNGQIFILRGEKTYTLTGQEVK